MNTEEYVHQQTVVGLSHESDNERWSEGQRRFVRHISKYIGDFDVTLDCACGDGVAMRELASMKRAVIGMDIAEEKLQRAGSHAFYGDMHKLEDYPGYEFNAVLSSHTLEHAHDPGLVVDNFRNALLDGGLLFVVLPFPDPGTQNDSIHVGKYVLGTHEDDEAKVVSFFTDRGFRLVESKRDDYREPELWLVLKKEHDVQGD